MMEFATMRQYQVPVKIVVIANQYLGMVREYQQNTYKGRYSVVELGGGPDLEKLAQPTAWTLSVWSSGQDGRGNRRLFEG